uniref:Serpin domain-containing protein n=1 Tax=Aceria tosichella TaxID=561515 RepID=A0A6G1S3P2_9ACAR
MKLSTIVWIFLAVIPPASQSPLQAEPERLTTTVLQNVTSNNLGNYQQSNTSTMAQESARLLTKPSAPYAIEDSPDKPSTTNVRSLVFRLITLNQTIPANENGQEWSLSELGQRILKPNESSPAGLDIRSLLDTLDRNNLTSEVYFDDSSPGSVNITITNLHNMTKEAGRTANRLLLEDLLDESKYPALFNVSSVMKDNHRFMGRNPVRSRPSNLVIETSMTVPPIRRTVDVVAENYTTRKIAEEANIFALKMINQLNVERLGDENMINSPFSIYQGLALLLSGSMGDTSRELDKMLLSVHSAYDNLKLTHDQDRSRLMSSFNDAVRELHESSTNHFRRASVPSMNCTLSEDKSMQAELDCSVHQTLARNELVAFTGPNNVPSQYRGGSEEQHFIVANNLLFSPSSYEISTEFKHTLNSYYNNTALARMEIGSTESIQVINEWVRKATAGLIPAIINKKNTFDEFNVMTLLSTSWLSQEWLNPFKRISSSLRSSIRLKGQTSVRNAKGVPFAGFAGMDEPLMEFVDDHKGSHFVDYIRSEPTRHILNYHTILNKQWVDVVVVPFRDSNQRLITITPLQQASAPITSGRTGSLPSGAHNLSSKSVLSNQTDASRMDSDPLNPMGDQQHVELPVMSDPSSLTKMMTSLAADPRRAMRSLWATIAPDLITKQTLMNLQMAKQRNSSSSMDDSWSLKKFNIPPKTQLSMPLIRIEADSTLTAPLNHIGLVNAFDPAQANFIGINGHPFNYNKLHLSNVLYKTTFNLNEDGINYDRTVRTLEPMRIIAQKRQHKLKPKELELEEGELVNEVKLNTPFMFLIADIKTKLVLYTGVVRNPAKENSSI